MTAAERFWNAVDAVEASEEENPAQGKTIGQMVQEELGLDDEDATQIIGAIPISHAVYRAAVETDGSALVLTWLAGLRIGRQLGIAEGSALPSLFSSTQEPTDA